MAFVISAPVSAPEDGPYAVTDATRRFPLLRQEAGEGFRLGFRPIDLGIMQFVGGQLHLGSEAELLPNCLKNKTRGDRIGPDASLRESKPAAVPRILSFRPLICISIPGRRRTGRACLRGMIRLSPAAASTARRKRNQSKGDPT